MINSNTEQYLHKLGLRKRYRQIIKFLIDNGVSSISELSKNLSIPRSSIYRYIDELEKEGWVKYEMSKQGKEVSLTNLASQKALVDREKKIVREKGQILQNLIELVDKSKQEDGQEEQVVRYFEGESGMRQIHWNATYTANDMIRVFTALITRDIVGDKFYDTQLIEASKKKIPIQILVDKSYKQKFFDSFKSSKEYYSPLPKMARHIDKRIVGQEGFELGGKFMIYNNVIANISFSDGKYVGSEIVSNSLSTSFKSIFDLIWNSTKSSDRINYQKET